MYSNKPPKRVAPPLNSAKLRALALHYAGRYATTRAKLAIYLNRKIRERGWDDEKPVEIETLINSFAELGYVNDAGFAEARSRAFIRRGLGTRRLAQDLDMAGIEASDSSDAIEESDANIWLSAENFARRKRIGPFSQTPSSREMKQKQLQAFLRAGHGWDIAQRFVNAEPGEEIESPD